MSEQKPHKWQEEICAWAGGVKVERQHETWPDDMWEFLSLDKIPNWNAPEWVFRIYDPYRELREAQGRGEVIEEMDANGIWRKVSDWAVSRGFKFEFTNNPDRYRIAPKPDYTVNPIIYYEHGNICRSAKVIAIIDGETGKAKSVELAK